MECVIFRDLARYSCWHSCTNPAPKPFRIGPTGAWTSIVRHLAARLLLQFADPCLAFEERAGVSIALPFEIEGKAVLQRRESALLAERIRLRGEILQIDASS